MMIGKYSWDEVFETENIEGKSIEELVSIALMAWGLCSVSIAPESFGRVMVMMGKKTGASTPDQYHKLADDIIIGMGE